MLFECVIKIIKHNLNLIFYLVTQIGQILVKERKKNRLRSIIKYLM